MTPSRQLRIALACLAALVVVGVAGYRCIEGWGAVDSLYMTVITLATVGYSEVHPLSALGRVFTIGLIAFGVVLVMWVATSLVSLIVSEELRCTLRVRRVEHDINRLRDHFVVCGHGRMGREICRDFSRAGTPHVVIESDPAEVERLRESEDLFIAGDASEDSVLLAAGVERARGLIAVASGDATNTFITLTARKLNPELHIVARSVEQSAESKLLAAGASRVVSPWAIGGRRIAAAALRPTVVEFLETVMHLESADLGVDECVVGEHSKIVGHSLVEGAVRQRTGAVVLAIKHLHEKGLDTRLDPEHAIDPGDLLVALGTAEQLRKLSALAQG